MPYFRIKDLLVNVLSERGSGGGAALCGEDGSATVPTPFTPYILVAAQTPLFEYVAKVTPVAREDVVTRLIDEVALDFGRQVVVATVQAGGTYRPNPECEGASTDTIPTPLTPIIHGQQEQLRSVHLSSLRTQLQEAIGQLDVAERESLEVARNAGVKTHLEEAIRALG